MATSKRAADEAAEIKKATRSVETKGLSMAQKTALAKALNTDPRNLWKPEEIDDNVLVTITSIEMVRGQNGPYPIAHCMDVRTGEPVNIQCSTVLQRMMDDQVDEVTGEIKHEGIFKLGRMYAVVYKGKSSQGQRGQPAALYSVEEVDAG